MYQDEFIVPCCYDLYITWLTNVVIVPLVIIQYTVIAQCTVTLTANFIIECTSVKYSLKSNVEISWVELLQWRAMKLLIVPLIYLLLTLWLSMNSSTTWKVLGVCSLLVVISMIQILSLKNNGSIILKSFTVLLYISIYHSE